MKTQIKKQGNSIIISMDGKLDFGTHIPLRENLNKLAREHKTDSVPKKIIVDLAKLEFVGSSGISSFVQTMREFNSNTGTRPQYCNVGSEFRKIIEAFDNDELFDFGANEIEN